MTEQDSPVAAPSLPLGGEWPVEGSLLLAADLRILACSPDLAVSLWGQLDAPWGIPLAERLPAVAARLSSAAAGSPGRANPLTLALRISTAASESASRIREEPLFVSATAVSLSEGGGLGWFVTFSGGAALTESEARTDADEVSRRLALQQRTDAEHRVLSSVTHDLNNTFQTLSGTLWLLQEQVSAPQPMDSHLSRIEAACRQGIALLQVQSSLYSRGKPGRVALADLVNASEPLLRRLLRDGQRLSLHCRPVDAVLVVDRSLGQSLILQLANFVGAQAAPGSTVQVALRACLPPKEDGTLAVRADLVQLSFCASLPTALPAPRGQAMLKLPGPLWACGKVAEQLGARFTVQIEGTALRLSAWFLTDRTGAGGRDGLGGTSL